MERTKVIIIAAVVVSLAAVVFLPGYFELRRLHGEQREVNRRIDLLTKQNLELEKEIQQLDDKERKEFLASLGLEEPSLNRLIKFAYKYADLISFITAGEKESHSWTIKNGATAQQSAGVIHSDIERGFIRAEVIHFEDLKKAGSEAEAKKMGLYRLEGKEYIVKDGDIIVFRFNI